MHEDLARHTRPHPLFFTSSAIEWLRAHRSHGLARAFGDLFAKARLSVATRGPSDLWSRPGQGALFIGDHRNGFEFAPLLALFASFGREDIRFVATPLSMQSRILGRIAPEDPHTIAVIPRAIAKDRSNVFNRDLHWRLLALNDLPTMQEIARINAHAIDECVRLVSEGHLVVWFPTGYIYDARTDVWQRGIGRVIKLLQERNRNDAAIVPFRFDDFPRLRLLRKLNRAARGLACSPYEIRLALGHQKHIGDLAKTLTELEIVQLLRDEFRESFTA